MKKLYEVEMCKVITETATIRVEAESEKAAEDAAFAEVESDDWNAHSEEMTVELISEVEEETD